MGGLQVRKGSWLLVSLLISVMMLGVTGISRAQPFVVMSEPGPSSDWVSVNTYITVQFSESMQTWGFIDVEDEYENTVGGTMTWSQTVVPNDTITLIPDEPLKSGRHYAVEVMAVSESGEGISGYYQDYSFGFMTRPSSADVTPPTVQGVYPYDGMTGVPTTEDILIKFSEAMTPGLISSDNVTLAGPGIAGPGDYGVEYNFEDGMVTLDPNSPLSAFATYTVTISTDVRDRWGNPLAAPYEWSFTTGAADTVRPTVSQTIPASGDERVSTYPWIHVVFSEDMDPVTLQGAAISLHDDTGDVDIAVHIFEVEDDYITIVPLYPSELTVGHVYTVTVGTGAADLAGNTLLTQYQWSFTVAGTEVDSDPVLLWGLERGSQMGFVSSDGATGVELELGVNDDITAPLTVTATTPPSYSWALTGYGEPYEYQSGSDEGLSSGPHVVSFSISDDASNEITFQRDVHIFNSWPAPSSPANGAAGVSTTPAFQWTRNGTTGVYAYQVVVFDSPDPEVAEKVWAECAIEDGSGTYSVGIPGDKALAPNTTYYWGVRCVNKQETGGALSALWSFTTSGSPPPPPEFEWVTVRSDDRSFGMRWNAGAKVLGPSPADIAELTMTGPGGVRYTFTEDNIQEEEQGGLYYWTSTDQPIPEGTYTFTVRDTMGRSDVATKNYASVSLPRVSSATMTPANGSYVNTATATLSWTAPPGATYYRVMVFACDRNGVTVYTSPRSTATSVPVPAGYLQPDTPYRWRVEVFDTVSDPSNRSVSDTLTFSTGNASDTFDIQYAYLWTDHNYYGERTIYGINVRAVLPQDVSTLYVNRAADGFRYDFTGGNIMLQVGETGTQYNAGGPGYLPDGSYWWYFGDTFGNSDSQGKDHTSLEIPVADHGSLLPANNAYLDTLTPTLSWDPVAGTPRYYRVKIQPWNGKYLI